MRKKMENNKEAKWVASGKLIGVGAIVLFSFSLVIIFIEGYETTNGLSLLIILFSFFLYLLYSSIKTWNTIYKPINFIDNSQNKLTRISELNKKYLEGKKKITDFLKGRIVNYSESNEKRFGFTFTKFVINERNVIVFIKYPMGSNWKNNSIEIRGGLYSDLNLIQELKQFIDGNIV
jgi:hypothetical protein